MLFRFHADDPDDAPMMVEAIDLDDAISIANGSLAERYAMLVACPIEEATIAAFRMEEVIPGAFSPKDISVFRVVHFQSRSIN